MTADLHVKVSCACTQWHGATNARASVLLALWYAYMACEDLQATPFIFRPGCKYLLQSAVHALPSNDTLGIYMYVI